MDMWLGAQLWSHQTYGHRSGYWCLRSFSFSDSRSDDFSVRWSVCPRGMVLEMMAQSLESGEGKHNCGTWKTGGFNPSDHFFGSRVVDVDADQKDSCHCHPSTTWSGPSFILPLFLVKSLFLPRFLRLITDTTAYKTHRELRQECNHSAFKESHANEFSYLN